jgi:DNA-binding beta-propeller fold protein YncE
MRTGGSDSSLFAGGPPPFRIEFERVVGGYGAGPGQMAYPEGVAVDNIGRLFVADTGNDRVQRFDPGFVFLGQFGGFGFEPDQFDKPRDLFIGSTLHLWVLDGENRRVVKYDLEGRLAGVVLDLGGQGGGFSLGSLDLGGLAADAGGLLYLSESSGDRILTFNPLGGALGTLGGYGEQPGLFRFPTGISVDRRGNLIVADGGNGRVQALDPFGGFLRAWPLAARSERDRVAVAALPDGQVAIAEAEAARLTVWSRDGRLLARLEGEGAAPGQMQRPRGLAADRLGRLYVADTDNHRIQIFRVVDARSQPEH